MKRAELEGATAQHVRAQDLIGNQLPAIQRGLSLWYRVVPHRVVVLVGCMAVALLVNVWLTLLAVVSCVLLWRLDYKLRHEDDSEYAHWEVPRARSRMAEIVGQAPLLGRLQSQEPGRSGVRYRTRHVVPAATIEKTIAWAGSGR